MSGGLVLALLVATLPAPGAAVESAAPPLATTLPTARDAMAVAWDGTSAYLFGGFGSGQRFLDDVVRFDPATETVHTMGAKLPQGTVWPTAAWHGGYAYLFGGVKDFTSQGHLDVILRYDPVKDEVRTMDARLPSARTIATAVSDGRHVYVFGGNSGLNQLLDQIVRYDPVTDTVEVMEARLPRPNDWMSGVWTGKEFFLFGGSASATPQGNLAGSVVRYDPATGVAAHTAARFLLPHAGTSAVWNGCTASIFGGFSYVGSGFTGLAHPTTYLYHPGLDVLLPSPDLLPGPRGNTVAVYHEQSRDAFVFGGRSHPNLDPGQVSYLAEIVAVRDLFSVGVDAPIFPVDLQGLLQTPWLGGLVPALGVSSCDPTVDRLRFLVDDLLTVEVPQAPLPWVWETLGLPDGLHHLSLEGLRQDGDRARLTVAVNVDNTAPQVAITSPSAGTVHVGNKAVDAGAPLIVAQGRVPFSASATDPQPGSGVAEVVFAVDGVVRFRDTAAPWTWTWPAEEEALGSHVLSATAVDRVGNARTESLEVQLTLPTTPTGLGRTVAALSGP